MSKVSGRLFNIVRNSTEDGPGIRTTVFLKGCPMHCPWCHNPEGIKTVPELVWYQARCMVASDCIKVCPKSALKFAETGILINRTLCDGCGICAEACPASALEVLGKQYSVDEVVNIVVRDKVFYEKSGGGVTVSGGEPSVQSQFCLAVLKAVRREGIHTTLDTCAGTTWEALGPLVESADMVLLDLKQMDPERHQKLTGVPLERVIENVKKMGETGSEIWVRTPCIPGYTDDENSIRKAARFIHEFLPNVTRYDLIAFNNLCAPKYVRLGLKWQLDGVGMVTTEKMDKLAAVAHSEGLENVHWSGMTKANQ